MNTAAANPVESSPQSNFASMPSYSTTRSGRLADAEVPSDQRTYATFTHLVPLIAHFVGIGTGLMGVSAVLALVMWRIRAKDSPFINDHGKESLNFQISLLIYALVGWALVIVLVGIPILVAVFILGIVGSVRACMAAHRGEYYRYPMTLRLLA